MYIRMYIHASLYIYIHRHKCIRMYADTYAHTYVWTYVHMHVDMFVVCNKHQAA